MASRCFGLGACMKSEFSRNHNERKGSDSGLIVHGFLVPIGRNQMLTFHHVIFSL